jgi:hypothetical protein
MSGAIPHSLNTLSWRCAQLKKAQREFELLPLPLLNTFTYTDVLTTCLFIASMYLGFPIR